MKQLLTKCLLLIILQTLTFFNAHHKKNLTDTLLNGRLISCTSKYDCGLSALLHDELHWLDIPQQVLCSTSLPWPSTGVTRINLIDYCVPMSDVASHRHLRSASHHQLTVPCVRCSTSGSRSFASAGPTVWNSLPDNLKIQLLGQTSFEGLWKPICLPIVSVSLTVH